MSDHVLEISFPLDGKYLRRECPFCIREFKVKISEKDLNTITERLANSITDDEDELSDNNIDCFCPYCGQMAPNTHWWTQEQLKYVQTYMQNIMNEIINRKLIDPMKKSFNHKSKYLSMSFKGKKLGFTDPWINQETEDMKIVETQCCDTSLKILDEWHNEFYCFECGFKYDPKKNMQ